MREERREERGERREKSSSRGASMTIMTFLWTYWPCGRYEDQNILHFDPRCTDLSSFFWRLLHADRHAGGACQ